jgi:hypothetical protein
MVGGDGEHGKNASDLIEFYDDDNIFRAVMQFN